MSAQIVVYTQSQDLKTLLEMECKSVTGFLPIVKSCMDELNSFIGILPKVDLLIIDKLKSESDYSRLKSSLDTIQTEVSNMVIINNQKDLLKNVTTFSPVQIEELIGHIKSLFGQTNTKVSGYISIPIESLIHFKHLPFDLYIQLSETNYVKRIHANEDIDPKIIETLKSKGVTEMHFERVHNRDFSLMLLNNMINKVETDYTSIDDSRKATNEVFQTTKDIVQSVGLPPKVIQVCERVMDKIKNDVVKNKDKLSVYLKDLETKTNFSFQFRLVEMTSFVATQLIENSSLPDKENAITKVVFASFFCDISLKDQAHLKMRDEESLKDLWVEDQKMIVEHALKASEFVEKYKNAPAESAIIIKQHHGSLSGLGFPKQIEKGILGLSIILIAAQEIAYSIIEGQNDTKKAISDLKTRQKNPEILKLIDEFEKCVNL